MIPESRLFKRKQAIFFLCLGAVLITNIYFRTFPISFPQLKKRASEAIEQGIRNGATQEVYKGFPQFDPLAKDRLIRNKISEYKKINKPVIKKQIHQIYSQLKDRYQDDSGQTYLMELDCWHWGRYVNNVLTLGHPGDQVIYGEQWDAYMLAPKGFYMLWDQFLFYFSAFLYKAFSLFKTVPLFNFLFYLPLFFTAVFIILLYIFALRHSGHLGAVVACLFVGLAPIFLRRSYAGWFDKDILNLAFPLLVTWAYLLADSSGQLRKKSIWLCLSAFWVGLFCFNWTHWWFIFLIIIFYEFLYLAYLIYGYFHRKNRDLTRFKEQLFSLVLFVVLSLIWVSIFSGAKPLIKLYNQIRLALILNKPLMSSIWPNVYSTVGELRRLNLREITHSVGNELIFALAVFSLLTLLIRIFYIKQANRFRRSSIIIFSIWFFSMSFASSRGIRFVVFLLIPLGLALGWALNEAYEYFRSKKQPWLVGVIVIFALFLNSVFIFRADKAAETLYPLMNDTWYKVLKVIREETPKQTVVNSWWDFGDWFKVVAERPVIFDGQSQDTPRAYWMAKALLSGNEKEAIGILRMLNNGGNQAFEIINTYVKDPLESVLLLETLFLQEPKEAQATLLDFLPVSAAEEVMKILFYNPPRACFVVDETMLPKMSAISFLGTWDFSRVYIAQNFDRKEKEQIIERLVELGRDKEEIQRLYQEVFLISTSNLDHWLSQRLQFYSGLVNGQEKDGIVLFDNGFIYNSKQQALQSNVGQVPRSLFYVTGNQLNERVYSNANVRFSVFVIKYEEGYKCVLLDRQLANSLFVRLYFFEGQGLGHFAPFVSAEESNAFKKVYNIIW